MMDPKAYPEWQKGLLSKLVATTKAASAVAGHDVSFERSIDPKFDAALAATTDQLLSLANQLLRLAGLDGDEFEDEDDIEERWVHIVDVVDGLLEKADTCVDEFTGATSKPNGQAVPAVARVTKTVKGKEKLEYNIFHANIPRPQLKFKTKPDNVEGRPWRPLLKEKPHAMVPLDLTLVLDENGDETSQLTQNPYRYEITHSHYPPHIFNNVDTPPMPPMPLESQELTWVDDKPSFRSMLDSLKKATEIAVDLEHHDYRSYYGFVCLMQISTRERDWIIDTLELREELSALNEVFTNPSIIKATSSQVFHGATSDVIWLQRDFGLYLVSLFDTYFASVALQFPAKSLAYLLLRYVDIEADKKYQLADWRIRPLPAEMLAYARSDTHYLLYIYDNLRRELVARSKDTNHDLMGEVLNLSRNKAMLTYQREQYDEEEGLGTDGWRKLLLNNKGPSLHSNLQVNVFKRLHRWRDQIAREEDESVNYVLPNRSLVNIAASLPHSMHGVVAACNPVPALVQVYAEDIAYIVQRTRKELAEEAERAEEISAKAIQGHVGAKLKNGITGSTHVWYQDDETAPGGVRSAMEAVKHGTQFNVWADKHDRLHSLILETSPFWTSLEHKNGENDLRYDIGGELADIKLSVPLPPLTAQIYMTVEDAKAIDAEAEEKEMQERVASLAEHPFVLRQKEEGEQRTEKEDGPSGSEVVIARHLGKKLKKRKWTNEGNDDEHEQQQFDSKPADKKKKKAKSKGKGLNKKVEGDATTGSEPIEQFDPYKNIVKGSSGNSLDGVRQTRPKSNNGPTGRSMTFKTEK